MEGPPNGTEDIKSGYCVIVENSDMVLLFKLLWSIRRRNPPCNAEDNLRAGHVVIEAWGGY